MFRRLALLVVLVSAAACAPHGPPLVGEVVLARPLALLPVGDCDGALARVADAAAWADAGAGLARDEQTYYSDQQLAPEREFYATGPSRQALEDLVRAGGDGLAPPAGHVFGYERLEERDGRARWRIHCMPSRGLELRALAGAEVVDEPDGPRVRVRLAADDARAFHALTEARVGRRVAVVQAGEVLMAPVVRTPIPGGAFDITLGPTDEPPAAAAAALLTRLLGP